MYIMGHQYPLVRGILGILGDISTPQSGIYRKHHYPLARSLLGTLGDISSPQSGAYQVTYIRGHYCSTPQSRSYQVYIRDIGTPQSGAYQVYIRDIGTPQSGAYQVYIRDIVTPQSGAYQVYIRNIGTPYIVRVLLGCRYIRGNQYSLACTGPIRYIRGHAVPPMPGYYQVYQGTSVPPSQGPLRLHTLGDISTP